MIIKHKINKVMTVVDGRLEDGRYYLEKKNLTDDGHVDEDTIYFSSEEWEEMQVV